MNNEKLKELLKQNNLSQRQFAKKIGVTPTLANNWCLGRYEPSLMTVRKIVKLFKLTDKQIKQIFIDEK